jgi:predicted thioesterase
MMLDKGLRVGSIGEAITTVTSQETALTLGSGAVNVYGTPAMIALMEAATVSAVDPYLTAGRVSIGMDVAIRHVSPTAIGEQITAIAEITRIDGKRVTLEVRAWDEHEMIGIGTIVRYLVDYNEFTKRIEATHG